MRVGGVFLVFTLFFSLTSVAKPVVVIDAFPGELANTPENLDHQLEQIAGAGNNPPLCAMISDPGESEAERFCSDPYSAICENTETHRDTQLARISELRQSIEDDALQTTIQMLKLEDQNITTERDFRRREDLDEFQNQRKSVRAQKLAPPPHQKDFASVANSIQDDLLKAVAASDLSRTKNGQFKNYLKKTRIVLASDLDREVRARMRAAGRLDRVDVALGRNIVDTCGVDFLTPSAFSQETVRDHRNEGTIHIVICDGVLRSLPFDDPRFSLKARLLVILGHELSHIMSAYWDRDLYKNMLECVRTHHRDNIFEDYKAGGKVSDSDLGIHNDADRSRYKDRLVSLHMEEISADFWGKETVAQYFRDGGKKLTAAEKISVLRQSYGNFCGALDSGTHPSGRFRIEFIGFDPTIRRQIGCKNTLPPDKVSCGLE